MLNDIKPADEIFDDERKPTPPHNHYWTLASTKVTFEPIDDGIAIGSYKMVEYAYLMCKCTAVVKTKVKSKD